VNRLLSDVQLRLPKQIAEAEDDPSKEHVQVNFRDGTKAQVKL
jgi:hypothetical protein